ncbi:MAG: FHA domain-containing protein, partial [Myxococcota bacterium]
MVRLDRLSPEVTIGRGRENTIWLDHPTVSRDHARIDYFRGRCTIYDRNSMNGIEVDGREVRKSPITPGLLVRCGECEIEVLPDPRIDLNAGLSRLRMLLHQEPSEACWNALSAALVSWPDTPELDLALDYVVQHLDESEAWAAYTRSAPQMWRSTLQNIL